MIRIAAVGLFLLIGFLLYSRKEDDLAKQRAKSNGFDGSDSDRRQPRLGYRLQPKRDREAKPSAEPNAPPGWGTIKVTIGPTPAMLPDGTFRIKEGPASGPE